MPKTLTREIAAVRQHAADFAATEFLHDESDADYSGFAPTQLMVMDRRRNAPRLHAVAADTLDDDCTPAGWATTRWVEEQEALAIAATRRAQAAKAARTAKGALDAAAASSRLGARRGWLARFEEALDRLLPGNLGSLLQLFICVSLSMALISSLLPLVDRI